MRFRDIKISTRLIGGFALMLVLVVMLGVVSYRQADLISGQTKTMYNELLQVRGAIGRLDADILQMRLGTRDLMLATTDREKQKAMENIEMAAYDAKKQFETLDSKYPGPKSDVAAAESAFQVWNTARQQNISLALQGKVEEVKLSILSTGKIGALRDDMIRRIKQMDEDATRRADSIYDDSLLLKKTLNSQLLWLVIAIILVAIFINYYFIRSIRKPIKELIGTARRFQDGDMDARSILDSANEFGILARAFNSMVERIQLNADLHQKVARLSESMLSEEDMRSFFRVLLPTLAGQTNSQMAAVYLLNDDKTHYEHFESIGISGDATKHSFSVDGYEGEFGSVLLSREIQRIQSIPIDTRFVFHTVSGRIVPREIISMPVLVGTEIVAIISLASVRKYTEVSNQLLNYIQANLNARVEAVLTYRKMKEFSKKLETQNAALETQKTELEAQKNELEAQSAELNDQNRELEMQKKQLHEASRLKSNFLSNMSHELRTPLNSVIALSGVLSRRLATLIPADEYGYLEVIERNGKHLLSLINDILDISRIEAGYVEVEVSKFNPGDLAAEIVTMIHPQAEVKNIQLEYIASERRINMESDMEKCRHILQNLVANAVKFTSKGKVDVSIRQTGDNVHFIVNDTGIGISDKHLAHIFDEFRQADGSTSRRFGGTGLGLAIAKKYANLLGGIVSVKSEVDKGSTFTLTLPLKYNAGNVINIDEEERPLKKAVPQRIHPKTSGGNDILLVEDSEPAIIQLKDFLESSGGYGIRVARDGKEALSVISKKIPDAIILDLMMPGVDGFQVLKSIREDEITAHIPVLVLTAKQITTDELKLLRRNNIHQLIQKGDVNRDELLQSLAGLVKKNGIQPAASVRPIQGKPVLLVVEDDADNMITVKALLDDNYSVITASDGDEALRQAQHHQPHVILMDISLPGRNGIDTMKAIRRNAGLADIPVIALTANVLDSDMNAILSTGFYGLITKPIARDVFFQTINKALYGEQNIEDTGN